MRKFILPAAFILCCVSLASAQTDYNRFEFSAGFSRNQVDTGSDAEDFDDDDFDTGRRGFNGFNLAATGNVSRYVGLKLDFSRHSNTESLDDIETGLEVRSTLYNVVGGIQIQNNAREGSRVRPFAHAMVGVARLNNRLRGTDAGLFDDDASNDTGFAGVFGGGVDVRLGNRVDLRLIQLDYNPTRLFDSTQHNFRIGIGFVFH